MPAARWTPQHDALLLDAVARGHSQAQFGEAHGFAVSTIAYHADKLRRLGFTVQWGGRGDALVAPPEEAAESGIPPRPSLDGWAVQFRRQTPRHISDEEARAGGAQLKAAYEARVMAGRGTTPHRPGTHVRNSTLHAPHVHGDAP